MEYLTPALLVAGFLFNWWDRRRTLRNDATRVELEGKRVTTDQRRAVVEGERVELDTMKAIMEEYRQALDEERAERAALQRSQEASERRERELLERIVKLELKMEEYRSCALVECPFKRAA